MLRFDERLALQSETTALVDGFLAELNLPARFSLRDLCEAVSRRVGTALHTYRTQMPSEIGGLGLAAQERTIILVNRYRGHLAEDFTILHELAHLVLGHLGPGHTATRRDEIQADIFAAMILKRMLRPKKGSSATARRLMRFFAY